MDNTNPSKNEMQAYHDARRKAYMDKQITHQDFYHDLAEKFGLEELQRIVFAIATREELTYGLARDEYFNKTIPIQKWDRRDPQVRQLAVRAGMRGWSLSDSVCTLKSVARRMVQDGEKNAQEGEPKLFTLRDDMGEVAHGLDRVVADNALLLRLVPEKPLDKLDLFERTLAKTGRFAYTIVRVA